jgi:hypothetical protein
LQDPQKFTQIWIFGLKTNHLATLLTFHPQKKKIVVANFHVTQQQHGQR